MKPAFCFKYCATAPAELPMPLLEKWPLPLPLPLLATNALEKALVDTVVILAYGSYTPLGLSVLLIKSSRINRSTLRSLPSIIVNRCTDLSFLKFMTVIPTADKMDAPTISPNPTFESSMKFFKFMP